jgi:hypothetical protein
VTNHPHPGEREVNTRRARSPVEFQGARHTRRAHCRPPRTTLWRQAAHDHPPGALEDHGVTDFATGGRYCEEPECGRKHYARGWCKTHYERWRCNPLRDPLPAPPPLGRRPPGYRHRGDAAPAAAPDLEGVDHQRVPLRAGPRGGAAAHRRRCLRRRAPPGDGPIDRAATDGRRVRPPREPRPPGQPAGEPRAVVERAPQRARAHMPSSSSRIELAITLRPPGNPHVIVAAARGSRGVMPGVRLGHFGVQRPNATTSSSPANP